MTVLSVPCPRCLHGNEDPFEVMVRDEVDWMNCNGCGKKFFFLLASCETCVDEGIFTWRNLPSPAQTRGLCCNTCGRSFASTDDVLVPDQAGRT